MDTQDPAIAELLSFFDFAHLPEHLARASAPFGALAERLVATVAAGSGDPEPFREARRLAAHLAAREHREDREAGAKLERVAREALDLNGYGWRQSLGAWLRLLLEAKDCAVRAALVRHRAEGITASGLAEAQRLAADPCPDCEGTGWSSQSNPGTGCGGRDEQIAVECPRGCEPPEGWL